MKKMKKIFALLIAMVMVLGMSTSVFAATIVVETGTTASDGTSSKDVLSGETYNAYKILNYTSDTTKTPVAYSYYLTAAQYDADEDGKAKTDGLGDILEKAGFEFTKSADGTQYVLTNADKITDAASVAEYLYTNKTKVAAKAIASASKTATADKEVVFSGLDTGYWFVTSSLGALCSLQSYDDEAMIVEKNQTITPPEKTVSDSEAQVGDKLTYTVTLTDVKGTNLAATIVDTMSEGLTLDVSSIKVVSSVELFGKEATETEEAVAGRTELIKDTDYTVSTSGTTVLTIVINADVMTALDAGQTLTVTYDATVNEKASIDGTEKNTVIARYSNQETDGKTVEITTEKLAVNKIDASKNALAGAQFKLYRTDSANGINHTAVTLTQMTEAQIAAALATTTVDEETGEETTTPGTAAANTVYYKVDTTSTNTTIDMAQKGEDGKYLYSSAVIFGLDKDSTYYLEETKSPEGYNLLDKEKEVALGTTTSIDVVNEAGSILPSTGGIGTTIFYIIGGVLVVGAGVVLVTRRRMNVQ